MPRPHCMDGHRRLSDLSLPSCCPGPTGLSARPLPTLEKYQQDRAGWDFGTGRGFLDYFADFAQQRKRLIAEHDERVENYPRQIKRQLLLAFAAWLGPILLWWGFRHRRTIIEASWRAR